APGPVLVLLWVFYLSLCSLAGVFLEFQWDILLLETAFLSIFFAPWKILPGIYRDTQPSPGALWLLRFLLFRLMFASGVVKRAGADRPGGICRRCRCTSRRSRFRPGSAGTPINS